MSDVAIVPPVADAPAAAAPAADKMEDVAVPAEESKETTTAADAVAAPASAAAGAEATEGAPAKEKKARAPRTPKAKAPAAAASAASSDAAAAAGTSSRGRERKAVQHFAPESIQKEETQMVIEEGPGSKLGDIENIKRKMDATNAQDSSLKVLFAACFPHQKGGNTKHVIKKHIREFSGYPKAHAKELREAATAKLEARDAATLKSVCAVLDIAESGPKAKSIERIVDFLDSPVSSGKAYSGGAAASSGSKRKSGSSSKKGKDGKPKRAMTSFILFSQEHRPIVMAKNPGIIMKDVGSKLGEMWRALSDSKKQKYKDAAKALKEGKQSDSGSDSSSGSGSEDEEEEEEEASEKPAKKAKMSSPPPAAPTMSSELRASLQASVTSMLASADLTQMSLAKMRAALATPHGESVVLEHKDAIKKMVMDGIAALQAKAPKKDD